MTLRQKEEKSRKKRRAWKTVGIYIFHRQERKSFNDIY